MSSQYLKKPLLTKKIEHKTMNGFAYASCQMQGWRKSMEDSIISKQISDGVYIFGVFDGHGGPEVARYVADNLPIFLKEDSFFKSKNYSKALSSVFRKIDDALQSVKGEEDLSIISKRLGVTHPQKQKISYRSGTTANVLLMTKDKYYVANIGDSRAILCNNNKVIPLSNDHKPDLPQEKLRIQKAGGYVSMGRVNGTLSLSRSFGDFDHKHFSNRPYQEQAVISVPEIIQINRNYGDNFILIGCDGVWQKYVSDSDKMMRHISQIKQKTKGLPAIMQNLFNDLVAKDIKERLGCDNMSAIFIELY